MTENIQGSTISIHPVTCDLPTLSAECRILIGMREDVRVALGIRVALVSKIFAGPPYNEAEGSNRGGLNKPRKQFYAWCEQNLRTRAGKIYSRDAVRHLLATGQAEDPEKYLTEWREKTALLVRSKSWPELKAGRETLRALDQSIQSRTPLPRVPLQVHAQSHPGLADEVNAMVSAWELARPEARAQFLSVIGACYQRRALG